MRASLLLLGILTLAGCASQSGPAGTASPSSVLGDLFSADPKLLGTRWVWVDSSTASGRQPAPRTGIYLLDFSSAQFVRVTADCNRGSAKYTLDGKAFKAGPVALTRMACAPGGQAGRFTAELARAERAEIRDGELLLSQTAATASTMRFLALQSKRYECAGKLKFGLVDLPGKDVALEFDGRYYRAAAVAVASGVAYEGQGVRFHGKGDEAMLDLGEQALRGCKLQPGKS